MRSSWPSRSPIHTYLIRRASLSVDEVQMIADEFRGRNLEFLMTLLVMRMAPGGGAAGHRLVRRYRGH